MRATATGGPDPIRLARIIGRLNVGGPAIQAITLTAELAGRGYDTCLLRGTEAAHEGTMDPLARRLGVHPVSFGSAGREVAPADLLALARLTRVLRAWRPHVVHTHAAKAGALGRLAALGAGRDRPLLVHTYHGHSLRGYFSGARQRAFLEVERRLAGRTDVLIAVSAEVRDELVAFGVAPPERFTVVPLGFDLAPFLDDATRPADRRALREELGVAHDSPVVTLVARLVPIKRVDRFLRIADRLPPGVTFAVVGDGELGAQLRAGAPRGLLRRCHWLGFRADIPQLCRASDVVVLTSDNEGTPVSLIEAQAAATPVVATAVGGVPSVVLDGRTGYVVDPADEAGFARRVQGLLDDAGLRTALGAAGRRHVAATFRLPRLVADLDQLYRDRLPERFAGWR